MPSDIAEDLHKSSRTIGLQRMLQVLTKLHKMNPKVENDAIIKYFMYSPLVDLHDTTITLGVADIEKTRNDDHIAGLGYRKYLPASVRTYGLQHDSISGLLTHIDFDKNVRDRVGENHGTWTGNEAYVPGKIGNAGDFPGNSYVTLDNESNFDFEHTSPFSISFWIKKDTTTPSTNEVHLSKQLDFSAGARGFMIWTWSGGSGNILFRLDQGTDTEIPGSVLNAGQWYHVTATYDGSSNRSGMKIYIDGALDVTGTPQAISNSILNNESVVIGAFSGGSSKFNGQLDEVKIWNKELTAAEVKILYNTESVTFNSPTQDEGTKNFGGAKSDGAALMKIDDHSWFDVTKLLIHGWFYLIDNSGSDQYLIHKGTDAFGLKTMNGNVLRFEVEVGGTTYNLDYTYTEGWNHVIAQAQSGNQALIIDGVTQDSDTQTGAIGNNGTDLGIFGTAAGGSLAASGTIIAHLLIADGYGDATWISDAYNKAIFHLDDANGDPQEVTYMPFIDSLKPMPNASVGMFKVPV